MKRRYTVLALSLILALALAVPALGGPANPVASISASVKQIATKALKTAKSAKKTANSALTAANGAQGTANSAQGTANSAQGAAKSAQSAADAAKKAAEGAQGTANNAQNTANAAKKAAEDAQTSANEKLGETFSEFGGFDGPNTTSGNNLALCPAGSEVTGGGYTTSGEGANEVVPIYAASYGDAWFAVLERIPGGTKTWSVEAIAVCAK
jgi:hypothetical protein